MELLKGVFYKIFKNIAECYTGRNLWWQFLAFFLTYVLVISGFDWHWFLATRATTLQIFMFPAVVLGLFVSVFLPVVIYLLGVLQKNFSLRNTAYALAQAGLLGLGISSAYKVFTGRVGPHGFGFSNNALVDISHQFQFGLYRGGAFQGWPSSHTAVAFAIALTLYTLYPNNKFIKYSSLIYAFYVGIGVSTNIHWFSDFVAGAILGAIIGITVGKSFLGRNKR
jgi:membrane-associated phospholipid phosphatase